MIPLISAELFRIIKFKSNRLLIALMLLLSVLFVIRAESFLKYFYGDSIAYEEGYKGRAAVIRLNDLMQEYQGEVTEEKILKAAKLYNSVYIEGTNDPELESEASSISGYMEMLEVFKWYENSESFTTALVDNQDISHFYELRHNYIKKKLQEKNLLGKVLLPEPIQLDRKTEPFTFYSGSISSCIDNFSLLIMLMVLLFIFMFSGTYSEGYHDKTDSLVRTSRFGRAHLARARNFASLILATLLYWSCIGIFLASITYYYTPLSMKTSIQMSANLVNFMPISLGQAYAAVAAAGYISSISVVMLTLFFSSISKAPSNATMVGVVIYFLPFLIGWLLDGNLSFIIAGLIPSCGTSLLGSFENQFLYETTYISFGNYSRVVSCL